MNTDKPIERKIICAVDKGYTHAGSDLGKLKVFYEILPSGDVAPINSTEFFCETECVFVTGQFGELKEKFGDKLFEATCIPSSFELRDGDCRYVTRLPSCSELKGLTCCQVFDKPLPSVSSPFFISSKKPLTKNILLRDNDNLFGPFECISEPDESSGTYTHHIRAIATPLINTPPFHIGKLGSPLYIQYLYEKTGSSLPVFLGNVKSCFEHAETIDYITDDQIISYYGGKIAQNAEIRSFNKGTITQIRKFFANSVEQKKFPERFKRLFDALDVAHNWEGARKELVDNFIKTSAGERVLVNYIASNKDEFFKEEKQAYLKQLREDSNLLVKELEELKVQKDKIEAEIRKTQRERRDAMDLSEEAAISIETLSAQQKEKLDTAVAEKRRILEDLSIQVSELQKKHSKYKDLEAVQQEIEYLDEYKDRAKENRKNMEAQIKEVAAQLRESNEKLTSRLLELKPHVDALSGIAPKLQTASIDYNVSVASLNPDIEYDELRDQLVNSVVEDLNALGRKTDYNSVANIIATIAQSQFTLFSGRPGTGKTSLAKMLGSSLGLKKRLLNIPVARGWTSSRDVLGFYNALSSSFNPSATGLYELLTQLNKECKANQDAAPAICLLDEFNLSQPEHYFSPFLEMADPESKRIIATGDQSSPYLEVPQYLRFLCTINNDESVQSLTPRMVDRSAIISFDDVEPDFDISLSTVKYLEDRNEALISGNKFLELFTPRSLGIPQEIERTLKLIIEVLREENPELGMPISVSFRKVKAIRAYFNVTNPMYIGSLFVALDYAVSQHIIPLLNGYGQNFGKRLTRLLDVIPDDMEISNKMLKRIINAGNQNMFTYGFNL